MIQHHHSRETRRKYSAFTVGFAFLLGLSVSQLLVAFQKTSLAILAAGDDRPNLAVTPAIAVHESSKLQRERDSSSTVRLSSKQDTSFAYYKERYNYQPPRLPRNVSVPTSSCGEPPEFVDWFRQGVNDRSAHNEDGDIYKLFRNGIEKKGRKGTFLELGAFNGVRESNTKFFEDCLGWEGLLIEGNPKQYAKLVVNRPFAHRMSFAPSCSVEQELRNETIKFLASVFTNARLAADTEDGHKLQVSVPCGSLTRVIKDVFVGGHVDFFSLDVEGAEPLVLDNLDFDQVFIELLMVESYNGDCPRLTECESRNRVRERMKRVGYKRYSDAIKKSDLYIHPKSKYQILDNYNRVRVIPIESNSTET